MDRDREDQDSQLLGTTFAPSYEIMSILGKGASSVVYRARFIPMDQLVAIKVLNQGNFEEKAMRTLKREIRHAGKLKHPNVAGPLRVEFSEDGTPFLVAELVEGISLSELLDQRGRLHEEEFLNLFDQVMSGLEHAHSHGIVHCDLKPSNIMVQIKDREIAGAKIVDFGISKSLSSDTVATVSDGSSSSGGVFGTPAYMSPEQCQGKRPDISSDIYSLGCVMYECITGVQAFEGESAFELITAHVNVDPKEPTIVVPDLKVSTAVQNGIMSALQKDPRQRPGSVAELRAALQGFGPVVRMRGGTRSAFSAKTIAVPVMICFILATGCVGYLYFQSPNVQSNLGTATPDAPGALKSTLPSTAKGLFIAGDDAQRLDKHEQAAELFALADTAAAKEKRTDKDSVLFRIKIKENLARELLVLKKVGEAGDVYADAIKLVAPVNQIKHIALLMSLSQNLEERGEHAAAVAQAKKAIAIAEMRVKSLSGATEIEGGHKQCSAAWKNLAQIHALGKEFSDAERAWQNVLTHHKHQISVHNRLLDLRECAQFYVSQGHFPDAEKKMREYMKLAATYGNNAEDLSEVAYGHEVFGDILMARDRKEADLEYVRSIEASEVYGSSALHYNLATRLYKRYMNMYAMGKVKEGDELWRESEKEFALIAYPQSKSIPLNAAARAAARAAVRSAPNLQQ